MKYYIEIELPDNEVISEDIKITPITWYYHGCSGQAKAKLVEKPVKPIRLKNWYKCPSCGQNIVTNMKHCPGCGKRVDWKHDN